MGDIAKGLKPELKNAPASANGTSSQRSFEKSGKESEKRCLKIIKDALKKEDRRQTAKDVSD